MTFLLPGEPALHSGPSRDGTSFDVVGRHKNGGDHSVSLYDRQGQFQNGAKAVVESDGDDASARLFRDEVRERRASVAPVYEVRELGLQCARTNCEMRNPLIADTVVAENEKIVLHCAGAFWLSRRARTPSRTNCRDAVTAGRRSDQTR